MKSPDRSSGAKTIGPLSRLLYSVLALSIMLVSYATAQTTTSIRIGVASGAATMDPHLEPDSTQSFHQQVFENLVARSPEGELVPALATEWSYSSEEAAWVFHLRQGVTFHNGQRFTARDVEFSVNRMLELGEGSPEYAKSTRFVREVEVIDDATVKFYMVNQEPDWINNLTVHPTIIPAAYFMQVGAEEFARQPIGTGPYRVVRFARERELVLESNSDYWGGEPTIVDVTFRVIPDTSTRVAELLAGGVDLIQNVPMERAREIESNPSLQLFTNSSTVNLYLGFNTTMPPFDDVRVRRAVAMAIPTDDIVQALFGDFASPASTVVQRTSLGHDSSIVPYEYDPSASRSLLAEAGHGNGLEMEIEVAPLGQWPKNTEVAEAIAGALQEAGIRATVSRSEFADFFARYREGQVRGAFVWGNTSPTFDAFRHLSTNFHSGSGARTTYWNDTRADNWISEAGESGDPAVRAELFARVQQLMHDLAVVVPLLEYSNAYGMSDSYSWSGRRDNFIIVKDIGVQ